MATKAKCATGKLDALMAEALSCMSALQLQKEKGFQKVVESNSLLLVSVVNNSVCYFSIVGLIFKDCKEVVLQAIPDSYRVFVKRSTNRVAHILARAGSSESGLGVWVQNLSDIIRIVLSLEMV